MPIYKLSWSAPKHYELDLAVSIVPLTGHNVIQGVVTTMCPVLPPATAIKKFDRQNGRLIVWFIPWSLLDRLIYFFWGLDRLISCSKRTRIQANTIGHAHFPFMHSVRDQNVRKIAVADGSTGHIVVTTPCYSYWSGKIFGKWEKKVHNNRGGQTGANEPIVAPSRISCGSGLSSDKYKGSPYLPTSLKQKAGQNR